MRWLSAAAVGGLVAIGVLALSWRFIPDQWKGTVQLIGLIGLLVFMGLCKLAGLTTNSGGEILDPSDLDGDF